MNHITLTTMEGIKITGPVEKVRELVGDINFTAAVDPNVWYLSRSKGLIKIRQMASAHIRNAILVKIKDWENDMKLAGDPKEFAALLKQGTLNDKVVSGLIKELDRRSMLGGHDWSHSGYKF